MQAHLRQTIKAAEDRKASLVSDVVRGVDDYPKYRMKTAAIAELDRILDDLKKLYHTVTNGEEA